jgi:hypothetical protein
MCGITVRNAAGQSRLGQILAEIFGLELKPVHFAQVQINESLTFDFADEPELWGGQVSI